MRQERQIYELKDFEVLKLKSLKKDIPPKIQSLPDADPSLSALTHIDDTLDSIPTGGRKNTIGSELKAAKLKIDQTDLDLLAGIIAGLEMSREERQEIISAIANDTIVNIDMLLSPKKHSFKEIFNGYDTPAMKLLIDALAQEKNTGKGKGELLLCALSKKISKPSKGDLAIDLDGNIKRIEVKTASGANSLPRFADRDVKVTPKYGSLASDFEENYKQWVKPLMKDSGLNLGKIITIGEEIKQEDPDLAEKYFDDFKVILQNIFPGQDSGVNEIDTYVRMGFEQYGPAQQAYIRTSLNYYKTEKKKIFDKKNPGSSPDDEEGFLFMDLRGQDKSCTFFNTIDELSSSKFRLESRTAYPITNKDIYQYPAFDVKVTTRVANEPIERPAQPQQIGPADNMNISPDRNLRQEVPPDINQQAQASQSDADLDQQFKEKLADQTNPISQLWKTIPQNKKVAANKDIKNFIANGLSDEDIVDEMRSLLNQQFYKEEMDRMRSLMKF